MLLNRIWIGLFFIAMLLGLYKLLFLGDLDVFKDIVDQLFVSAELGFKIALYLTGALCLWMGIMEIGEKGGAVTILAKFFEPFFSKIFPEVPKNHPAHGAMMMNFSANMLGLDNAATPLGLKAMKELQTINPKKDEASNAQIMFLVLNTSGLTIIPVSVMAYKTSYGSSSPSDIFLPILIATFFASLVGIIGVSIKQRINLLQPVILLYLGTITAFIVGLLIWLTKSPEHITPVSKIGGNLLLFSIIIFFIVLGVRKKVNVYDAFIEGAKGGFEMALKIIPFLVAILVAIGVFKAAGAMEMLLESTKSLLVYTGVMYTEFVDALPVAIMKPLSGGAARGMMLEVFDTHGVDSFAGKVAATLQGSTETTLYVLAVYFGSVGIKNTRYAVGIGLLADLAGIIAAIFVSYLFFFQAG